MWRSLCPLVCAVLSLAAHQSTCQAGVWTFTATSDHLWSNTSNWTHTLSLHTLPDATDRVVIPSGETCEIASAAIVDTIEVGGTLIVDQSLEIRNNYDNTSPPGPDNSSINGLLDITGLASVIFTTNDHHVSGTGELRLEKTATMAIGSGLTVHNELTTGGIHGYGGYIDHYSSGTCTLYNKGRVIGDEDQPGLQLKADVALNDISGATWEVIGHPVTPFSYSTLQFERASNLNGDFVGSCDGVFNMHAQIRTCGALLDAGCGVFVTESTPTSFQYHTYTAIGTICHGNPGSSSGSTDPCSHSPTFIVTVNQIACSCP